MKSKKEIVLCSILEAKTRETLQKKTMTIPLKSIKLSFLSFVLQEPTKRVRIKKEEI